MANHMGSEKSRKGWFERMLPHIPYCGADEEVWITGKALQAIADVSEHQRSACINWGRGNYTPSREWALVSGRRGYRFVQTVKQAAPFVLPRYKSAATLLRLSYEGAQKPLINWLVSTGQISAAEAKVIERSVRRALEDIADLSVAI